MVLLNTKKQNPNKYTGLYKFQACTYLIIKFIILVIYKRILINLVSHEYLFLVEITDPMFPHLITEFTISMIYGREAAGV